jgi:hypothetical protein
MSTTANQSALILRTQSLRAAIWAHHYDLACRFTIDLAKGWKDSQFGGMALACARLVRKLADIPGSYDQFRMADDLTVDLAAEAMS